MPMPKVKQRKLLMRCSPSPSACVASATTAATAASESTLNDVMLIFLVSARFSQFVDDVCTNVHCTMCMYSNCTHT